MTFSLAAPGVATAHAYPRKAVPPAGATVQRAPSEIAIDFSEELEPRLSTIEVQDESGQRVDRGDTHTAPDDARRLVVGLSALHTGTYKVIWRVTSIDTHRTEGSYQFLVAP